MVSRKDCRFVIHLLSTNCSKQETTYTGGHFKESPLHFSKKQPNLINVVNIHSLCLSGSSSVTMQTFIYSYHSYTI